MKKILIICVAVATMSLTGCGKISQLKAHYTGQAAETCHDGIVYLQWTSGSTVKIDKNTLQPARCN